jgi:cysteine desulfurase/selenocysteine lyase
VIDAAQAVPHIQVDVQDLGADFVAFSSHKMLGPTGVGVLWGKYEILERMYPFMYGGEMINGVYIDHSEYKLPPHKFEAGTPMIGEVIALRSAVEYLEKLGMEGVHAHEQSIVEYTLQKLTAEFGSRLKIYGPQNSKDRGGVIAFTLKGCHPHDVAQILDEENIAIRAGHHCAMPLHTRLGIGATCRASFYVYNTKEDVDSLVTALQKVEKILK